MKEILRILLVCLALLLAYAYYVHETSLPTWFDMAIQMSYQAWSGHKDKFQYTFVSAQRSTTHPQDDRYNRYSEIWCVVLDPAPNNDKTTTEYFRHLILKKYDIMFSVDRLVGDATNPELSRDQFLQLGCNNW